MTYELKATPGRGGNRHPISARAFIIDHLAAAGEDYPANIHRAYKAELDRLASENGRRHRYHKATCASFEKNVHALVREGLIVFSGREEESDNPKVELWEVKPVRRYYRLK